MMPGPHATADPAHQTGNFFCSVCREEADDRSWAYRGAKCFLSVCGRAQVGGFEWAQWFVASSARALFEVWWSVESGMFGFCGVRILPLAERALLVRSEAQA